MNFPNFSWKCFTSAISRFDSLAWRGFVIFVKAMRWRCSWTNAGAASKKPIALSASWSVPTLAVTCCAGGGVFGKHVFFFPARFPESVSCLRLGRLKHCFFMLPKAGTCEEAQTSHRRTCPRMKIEQSREQKAGDWPLKSWWRQCDGKRMKQILQDFEKERFCKILKEDVLHDFLWCWTLNCAAWASDTKMQHDSWSCGSWEQTQIQEMGSNLNILEQKHKLCINYRFIETSLVKVWISDSIISKVHSPSFLDLVFWFHILTKLCVISALNHDALLSVVFFGGSMPCPISRSNALLSAVVVRPHR